MQQNIFDKIWNAHIVYSQKGYPDMLYIDRHFIHEVTSPQAFNVLRSRSLPVFRTTQTHATEDHNVPTLNQDQPIREEQSRRQVATLRENCQEFGVERYGLGHEKQGIVHVIGPEIGLTLPGMTIVCGDSHTSTHGAFGTVAFGIGTTEIGQVFASQCILQYPLKTLKLQVDGCLQKGTTAKDIILYIISQLSSSGCTGYFVEYCGSLIRSLSMEARMTICNMSIEMGARGGLIVPDDNTFEYIYGREFAPKGKQWEKALTYWKSLSSDSEATYDKEIYFSGEDIIPMITFGTNPGMGIPINVQVPSESTYRGSAKELKSALDYMGLQQDQTLLGKPIDYVFIGSCTNSRIEDLRLIAKNIKGTKKAANVQVWVVPGSQQVSKQIKEEGLDQIFTEAGFELRGAGCSACLGMNEDKIPAGKYCVSTSNRNFEGRQGQGARTMLASPLTAAAAAITGKITDPRVCFAL